MLLSELGAALRKARKERRLTLKQVAEQAGVHFTTLSSLERGKISELGVRKLLRVAETLSLELVLRPTGQRFTLDDVAKERAGQGVNKLAKKPLDKKGGLLASEMAKQLEANKLAELVKAANQQTGLLGSAMPNQLADLLRQAELAKSMDQKGGLLARALRGPLDGSSNAGAEDRVSIKNHKSTK
jgi:transcriptional regulator with XRE-family HTH domain